MKKIKKIIKIKNIIISFMNQMLRNKINQIKVKPKNQVKLNKCFQTFSQNLNSENYK
jgi:hypothetical protein